MSGFVPFASSFVPAGRNERKVPAMKYSRAKSSGNKKKKGGAPGEEGVAARLELQLTAPLAPVPPRVTARLSEKGVRLAQNMQVGPCIPVGTKL